MEQPQKEADVILDIEDDDGRHCKNRGIPQVIH
jgi:hypothetical protein